MTQLSQEFTLTDLDTVVAAAFKQHQAQSDNSEHWSLKIE